MEQHSPAGPRVGFFGGSFDPPHQGHLAVALAARAALRLDTVLFAPVGAQPLKPQGSTAGFEDRLEMTRLAIHGIPGFEVSLADAPKPAAAPNYTLETLIQLRASLPDGGILFCLMGADSFLGLRRWHRSAEIPFVAPLIVASRPGQPLDDLRAALPPGLTLADAAAQTTGANAVEVLSFQLRNHAGETAPFFLLPGLHVEISASQIRDLIRSKAQGEMRNAGPAEAADASHSRLSRQELLPGEVLNYIRSHGLYR